MHEMQLIGVGLVAIVIVAVVIKLRSRAADSARPPAAGGSLSFFGPSEIETFIREHITDIGTAAFPDNADVEWLVHGFSHGPQLVLAEVEPQPDEVGYPRFKLGFVSISGGEPQHVATYCLEDGAYSLLSTAPGAPRNLPRHLES